MARPKLADAYVVPSRSFSLPTTPGRRLDFRGGHAVLYDARDVPHVLRREDVIVEPDPRWLDWLPDWLHACGDPQRVRANIRLPKGTSLEWQDDRWQVVRPGWEPKG